MAIDDDVNWVDLPATQSILEVKCQLVRKQVCKLRRLRLGVDLLVEVGRWRPREANFQDRTALEELFLYREQLIDGPSRVVLPWSRFHEVDGRDFNTHHFAKF